MSQRKMEKVLLLADYEECYMQQIKEALGDAETVYLQKADDQILKNELENADVVILGKGIDRNLLAYAKSLKWLHMDAAGLNDFAKPEILGRNIMVTGTAGRSENALAEHAFYLILALNYKTGRLLENQKNHFWESGIYSDRAALYEKTIGIIGFGHTGKCVAEYAKAFHMQVLVYNRSENKADLADRMFSSKESGSLDAMLPLCDYVVLTCALNDETWHLMNKDRIGKMKNTACLINMARGAVVDENALCEALKESTIAGAGCDTFETEPLGKDSLLWDIPNMLVTPHCTPAMPDKTRRSVDILCENIRRYKNGEILRNLLKPEDLYTKK
ncbi:MAG: D-2-hydroxyacid dehydrogenase [Lachnospiraceae bacterium]|nr:D-2-hydroxyacid dehydrogenase [Lachnospiraceae bacterium]